MGKINISFARDLVVEGFFYQINYQYYITWQIICPRMLYIDTHHAPYILNSSVNKVLSQFSDHVKNGY